MPVLQKRRHLKTVTEVLVRDYAQLLAIADVRGDVATLARVVVKDNAEGTVLEVAVLTVQKAVVADVQEVAPMTVG